MTSALRVPGTVYLLSSAIIARLPQAMSSIGIVRLVRDQGGSFQLASALTAVFVAVGVFGQPFLARLVDRTGKSRAILITSSALASLGFVGLALTAVSAVPLAVLCAVVAGFATPPVESCLRSLWARMMKPGAQLHSAFSFDAAAQEIVFITGPLITAVGILAFGAQGNMYLMAAIGLVGTVVFAAHSQLRDRAPLDHRQGDATLRTPLLAIPALRRLVAVQFTVGVPIGVLTISATAYGELVGAENVSAWGLAVNAVGALIGAVVIARSPLRAEPQSAVRWVLLALAVLYVPTALAGLPVYGWLAAALVAGFALPPLLTQIFTLTERISPAERLNEANAWIVSAMTVGIATGTVGAGFVVEALPGAWGITAMVLAGSAVAALGAAVAAPRALTPVPATI